MLYMIYIMPAKLYNKYPKKDKYAKKYYKKKYKKKAKGSSMSRIISNAVDSGLSTFAKVGATVLGNAILPGAGGVIGGGLADLATAGINAIRGQGDYQVMHNTLLNRSDAVPQFNVNNRSTRVRHREYIADVTSSATPGAFGITGYSINPAIQATFPWLASVAANYEEYRIHGMIFEFKTMSADALNSTNTALGQVVMATQYNVLAPDFVNKQQMENYEFGCSCKPSLSLMHAIECQPTETPIKNLFTRISNVSGSDLRLYDFGKFFIATNGLQAASVNLGELWVSYDIELFKPRLTNGRTLMDHVRAASGITTSAYFGADHTATSYSNFGCVFGSQTIVLPSTFTGNVFIYYDVIGDSGALTAPSMTGSNGAAALNIMTNNTLNTVRVSGTATALSTVACYHCTAGGLVTFASGVLPANATSMDCYVIAIPDPMN